MENLLRSIPSKLSLNVDLSKIKTTKIFKWLKSKNISDKEMMRTFNCGVGFCLIVQKKMSQRLKEHLPKNSCLMKLVLLQVIKKKSSYQSL